MICKLGDFSEMKYGSMPNKSLLKEYGKYPVFSGYRIVGYYDTCNLNQQELIVVARGVGGTGDVKLSPGACFLTNLSIAVIVDETVALKKYLYYYFLKSNLRYLDSGSAQSQITISDLQNVEVSIPPLNTQRQIAAVLSALDAKIELNNQIAANLQQQAQTIFKSWFVDFEPWGGEMPEDWKESLLGDICAYSQERIAVSKLTVDNYYSTENMLANKLGATKAEKLPTTTETTACHEGDTLISNIRPYFKKILYCYDECGCSLDVLCFRPQTKSYSAYVYNTLYNDKFFDFMMSGAKGTKMPRGDKQQIMTYTVVIPTDDELEHFDSIVTPMLTQIHNLHKESATLATLRDALLPRLMSGEIDVSDVKI